MTNAKTFLEKRYSEEMALEDAIHTALLTLKEGFEGQVGAGGGEKGWAGAGMEKGGVGGRSMLAKGLKSRWGERGRFRAGSRRTTGGEGRDGGGGDSACA
jgi:hypothetical protein